MKRRTSKNIELSICILNWNNLNVIIDCLDSIFKYTKNIEYEVIVVDNNSTDGSLEKVVDMFGDRIVLIKNQKNEGFAKANNQGYNIARGKYFLLLNSDTEITQNTFKTMVDFLKENKVYGAATCKLLNPDKSLQVYMHRRFPSAFGLILALTHKQYPKFRPNIVNKYLYLDNSFTSDFDIDQAAGTCFMVRKGVCDSDDGILDEQFNIYYNDVDLAKRLAKMGLKIRCLCSVPIIHHKGYSTSRLDFLKNGEEYVASSLSYFNKHNMNKDYYILKIIFIIFFSLLSVVSFFKRLFGRINKKDDIKRTNVFKAIFKN